jgi:prepilin-type N-terminal cleavage/methylation domain-containing protein
MRNLRPQRPDSRETHARAFFFSRAFTLVELVMVMAVVAVIAAMAAPRFAASIARQRADGAASRVVSDLAYARSVARMTSASVTVTFDPTHGKYTNPSAGDPLMGTPAPYVVDLTASPYRATMLGGASASVAAAVPATGSGSGTFAIAFDGYGEPTAVGWVIVKAGDWSRQISIDKSGTATVTNLTSAQVGVLLP